MAEASDNSPVRLVLANEQPPEQTNMQSALALLEEAKRQARSGVSELVEVLTKALSLATDIEPGAPLLPVGVVEEARQLRTTLENSIQKLVTLDQRSNGVLLPRD